MSPFKVPEAPYTIDTVMQSIREQLRLGHEAEGNPSADTDPVPDDWTPFARLLARMQRQQDERLAYHIHSHRPFIGAAVNFIKKIIYWGVRPHFDALYERQEAFNSLTIRALREQMAATRKTTDGLQTRLDELIGIIQRRYDTHSFFATVPGETRLEALDHTRGAYWEVVQRQNVYAPLFLGLPGRVIELGCGRGEMLAILQSKAVSAWGVDLDPLMVETARGKGLEAYVKDALAALTEQGQATLGGVFAAQVAEHLFPGDLLELIRLAADRLASGGRLLLETVNPASPGAMAKSYYQDLDHKQPIHPDAMKILLEQAGFEQVEIGFLSPFSEAERLPDLPPVEASGLSPEAHRTLQDRLDRLNAFLFGYQDYYVTGVRTARSTGEGGKADA